MQEKDFEKAAGLLALATGMLFVLAIVSTSGIERLAVAAALVLLALAAWRIITLWRALQQRLKAAEAARRKLEEARAEAERISSERGRLLAITSHELRTPLNGVLGMAALLAKTDLTPEQANYVQAIDASGRLLLSTVNTLLQEARTQALQGSGTAQEPFDVAQVAEEICELLSPRAHARGLDVAVFVHPDVDGKWLGDSLRLRQVLLNLLGNAVKFTEKGGVLLNVRVIGNGVHFAVCDTGPGIAPEERKLIFESFHQGSAATREDSSGLGLAITRRLVESMGGRLKVYSRPGKGSIFHFHLPLKQVELPSQQRPCLQGSVVHLALPKGPSQRALVAYVRSFGGRPQLVQNTDELAKLLHDGSGQDIICGSEWHETLRLALDEPAAQAALARCWLLLPPEERIEMRDLLNSRRLAGFLLRPLRRATFVRQFIEHGGTATITQAASRLRGTIQSAGQAAEKAEGSGRRILLAEDDMVSAQVARIMLQRAGFEVAHAADGAAAVQMMERFLAEGELPVCVLMDMHMPRLDGLQATQRIRQLEAVAQAPRTPIIALTASEDPGQQARCLAAGMDGFMSKPFDEEALLDMLKKWQEKWQAQAPAFQEAPSSSAG